jgi:hypothetical protein
MNELNHDKLVRAYVETCVENMDIADLITYATECMTERLYDISQEELINEITKFLPELLDEFNLEK